MRKNNHDSTTFILEYEYKNTANTLCLRCFRDAWERMGRALLPRQSAKKNMLTYYTGRAITNSGSGYRTKKMFDKMEHRTI